MKTSERSAAVEMAGVDFDAKEFQIHEELSLVVQVVLDKQHSDTPAGKATAELWGLKLSAEELFLAQAADAPTEFIVVCVQQTDGLGYGYRRCSTVLQKPFADGFKPPIACCHPACVDFERPYHVSQLLTDREGILRRFPINLFFRYLLKQELSTVNHVGDVGKILLERHTG